jgi:hypothetical protein
MVSFANWDPLLYDELEEVNVEVDLDEIRSIGIQTAALSVAEKVPLHGHGTKVYGREVGDDRVDLSQSPDALLCTLVVQEAVIHMVTSPEDTGVCRSSWNFCETTGGVPTDPSMGYDFSRRTGDFTNLGFNDSVVLRIILDVQKGEGDDHSSTESGKMSMLGSRLSTPRQENRGTWQIASLFQDAALCTHQASEPKYLPTTMGGSGVTALFDNPNNILLYVLAYKGGTYRRIYATAVAEAQTCLEYLERGLQTAPILCPRLREKQEYFWGTYAEMVFVPNQPKIKSGDGIEPPMPLLSESGGANRYQSFENRLQRTRHLLSRRQAEVEWAHTQRLQNIFLALYSTMEEYSAFDRDRTAIARAHYNGALSANSALQNLLRREATEKDARLMMGDRNFRTLSVGRRDFTMLDAQWVYKHGKGNVFSLQDLGSSTSYYIREEVSSEETFKVAGITLAPYLHGGERRRTTRTNVGLYQINSTMEEWSEKLLTKLKDRRDQLGHPLGPEEAGPIYDEDREWVNDDTGIIAQCLRETADLGAKSAGVILISGDRRLANQMAETCNVTVTRISPREVLAYLKVPFSSEKRVSINEISDGFRKDVSRYLVYTDTGSIASAAARMEEVEPTVLYDRTVLQTGVDPQGARYTSYTLSKVGEVRKFRTYTHAPVIRPSVSRAYSRPSSSIYSGKSWRDSGTGPPPSSVRG